MPAIHQLVAGFSNGDAISNEARHLRTLFQSWNFESDIFCEFKRILPELRKEARDVGDLPPAIRPTDIAFLHLSIGSLVNDLFAALPCRKVILYHNVTPSRYFDLIAPTTATLLARGRAQTQSLADAAEVNLADSLFNAAELESLGYRDVRVMPLLLDFQRLRASPDRKTLRAFSDGRVNILFVGRCAPNKRIEDALKAFHIFQKCVEPNSRFIHVGSFSGTERYYYLLLALARELGVSPVHFAGAVPQPALNAFYRSSHLFLCMSEHEGFCIPLVESMAFDLPILAFAAGAVPETLDGAGVLCREKNYEHIAEMMGALVQNASLRAAVVQRQRETLHRLEQRDLAAELRRHLAPLLTAPPP